MSQGGREKRRRVWVRPQLLSACCGPAIKLAKYWIRSRRSTDLYLLPCRQPRRPQGGGCRCGGRCACCARNAVVPGCGRGHCRLRHLHHPLHLLSVVGLLQVELAGGDLKRGGGGARCAGWTMSTASAAACNRMPAAAAQEAARPAALLEIPPRPRRPAPARRAPAAARAA